jgi:parallel beta-helix repeat protein
LIGGSSVGLSGLIWRNNYVHDNYGMGIWSDGNVYALYENNILSNNSEGGIFHEISWAATIRNNTLTNNAGAVAGMSCYWGAQIHLNDSSNVEIYGNTVTGSNGANGICAVSADRPGDPAPFSQAVLNMNVHNNTIYMNGSATSGLKHDPSSVSATGNSFSNNAWHVSNPSGAFWTWPGAADPATWGQWQSAGQDAGGSHVVWP